MKHEADGLYYLTKQMLVDGYACRPGVDEAFGERKQRAVATLRSVTRFGDRPYTRLGWLADRMRELGKITDDEWQSYDRARDNAQSSINQAQAFMDLLLARAKREGLVS